MVSEIETDICVIGAGSAGLAVAAGAVQMGARTVLVERGLMGGDCLNFGCVPSKALLRAGRAAHEVREAARFGTHADGVRTDSDEARAHVRNVIAGIEPHDSQERFEGLGVSVIRQAARFRDATMLEAGDQIVRARRFVVATGSRARIPPIPGLKDVDYLTNETIFSITGTPEHLVVVGGGPIGVEMAQAHRRLGARVTVVETARIMPRDDQELVDVVRQALITDGVTIREQVSVTGMARKSDGGVAVTIKSGEVPEEVLDASHVLVATGRQPNIDGLNLEAAGIESTPAGITVDSRLRSTNRRVFAAGDVAGRHQFTHAAGYHAGVVLKNALFRIPARIDGATIPWVTYTDPELANVGLTAVEARERHGDAIRVLEWPMAENDRARAEGRTEGKIKIVTRKSGQILGATVVAPHAGELIQPWILGVANKMKIGRFANVVLPYPTLGEAGKRAAGSFYTPTLFSERTRRLVRMLLRLG